MDSMSTEMPPAYYCVRKMKRSASMVLVYAYILSKAQVIREIYPTIQKFIGAVA